MTLIEIVWMAVFGLIVGLIARLLMPGRDTMGLLMTAVLGIAGSLLGTFLGRTIFGRGAYYQARWLMSVLGALILLFLYRAFFTRRE
jgi:uncharacterized membrane protein YeaQ/YmgE (transglycosylase-associated protein family)